MNVHYLAFALLHFAWPGTAAAALLASLELLLVELHAHGVEADLLKRLTATRQESAR